MHLNDSNLMSWVDRIRIDFVSFFFELDNIEVVDIAFTLRQWALEVYNKGLDGLIGLGRLNINKMADLCISIHRN